MQALASNAVVAEVAEDIGEVRQAVVLGTEAQVAVLVEPGCHGGAVGHQHPLPNVKLPAGPHTLSCTARPPCYIASPIFLCLPVLPHQRERLCCFASPCQFGCCGPHGCEVGEHSSFGV